ncbi:MAG: histidinol phosphate phosphatase domain-containing protein [Candidatus Bipolaricaulia bacterium]
MMIEFHVHTLRSDGEYMPVEMIRYALVNGFEALALTDHASHSNVEEVVEVALAEKEATVDWGIEVIVGVEVTHVSVTRLDEVIARARRAGAELILVHGETLVEPVEPGTNRAAIENPDVDILAHPGLIAPEEAEIAAGNGVFLELSAGRTHGLANGHVARMAAAAGAELLVNSDAHNPDGLVPIEEKRRIALGAGLTEAQARRVVEENPKQLLEQLKSKNENRRSH